MVGAYVLSILISLVLRGVVADGICASQPIGDRLSRHGGEGTIDQETEIMSPNRDRMGTP